MNNFYEITANLLDTTLLDYGCGSEALEEKCCSICPFHDQCVPNQLFYGCCCWEESMGDDL